MSLQFYILDPEWKIIGEVDVSTTPITWSLSENSSGEMARLLQCAEDKMLIRHGEEEAPGGPPEPMPDEFQAHYLRRQLEFYDSVLMTVPK